MARSTRHDPQTLWSFAAPIGYDLRQILDLAHLMTNEPDVELPDHNARVESFLIRFRTLLEFFYRDDSQHITDVHAWEYMSEEDDASAKAQWAKTRPDAEATLGIDQPWLSKAVSTRVAHASVERLYHLSWPVQFMAVAMAKVWAAFFDVLPDEHQLLFLSVTERTIEVLPDGRVKIAEVAADGTVLDEDVL